MMKKLMSALLVGVLALSLMGVSAEENAMEKNAMEANAVQETATEDETEDAIEDEMEDEIEENAVELVQLSGEITEVDEAYIVLKDEALGDVQVWLSEDTLFEGVEAGELSVGMYALVTFDGKMTRSLPPQITALQIGVYALEGEVVEIGEDYVMVQTAQTGEQVHVWLTGEEETLEDSAQETDGEGTEPTLEIGQHVIVYTNGMMTMSLPAQTGAIGMVVVE